MDDIVSELKELQRHASGLQRLIVAAEASTPRRAEGTDRTGTIRITIGPDGLPTTILVQDHWQRRVPGEQFGAAVIEAFSAAADERLVAWGEALQESGWKSTVDRFRGDAERNDQTDIQPPPPVPAQREPGTARPRPLDEMLGDLIRAFDNVDHLGAAPAIGALGTGSSAYGKFTLRISPTALISCVVDGDWASHEDAEAMMQAFDEALVQAKADLASKVTGPDPVHGLDRVLGEAMALLNDPNRRSES